MAPANGRSTGILRSTNILAAGGGLRCGWCGRGMPASRMRGMWGAHVTIAEADPVKEEAVMDAFSD